MSLNGLMSAEIGAPPPRLQMAGRRGGSVQLRLELLQQGGGLMARAALRGAADKLLERANRGAHVAEPGIHQPRLLPELGEVGGEQQHRLDDAERTLGLAG